MQPNRPLQRSQYLAAALASYFIWGFISLPIRALQGYPPTAILFFRVLLAAVLIWAYLLLAARPLLHQAGSLLRSLPRQERWRALGLTALGGVLLLANWGTFIYVVNFVNLRTAGFAYLICPVLTAVLGMLLLREPLGPRQWAAVTLAALSCVLLGRESLRELLFSLVVGFSYACYLVSQRRNNQLPRLVIVGGQMAIGLLVVLPLYPLLVGQAPTTSEFYLRVGLLSLCFTLIPQFLNLLALKGISSGGIGMLGYLNPILNFLVAYFVFGEWATTLQWVGYSLILVALVLYNLPGKPTWAGPARQPSAAATTRHSPASVPPKT